MAANSANSEFRKYWSQLTAGQKASLLNFISSFLEQEESKSQHDLELHEAEADYKAGSDVNSEEIMKQLKDWEKTSVLLLIKAFLKTKNRGSKRVSIEQYNKELEDAEAEFERSEIYTHEEVIAQSKKWVNGQ